MNPGTLPLFEDGPEQFGRGGDRIVSEGDRHLAAARRISKGMWRLPEHSPEETQAGQAICRHLLASLADWTETPL